MSFQYTLTKASKMGDRDEKYGQGWWCEVAEDLKPFKFNTMSDTEFKPGDSITCEETMNKRSTKGTDYLSGKKVQLVGSQNIGQPQTPYVAQRPSQSTSSQYTPRVEQPQPGIHEQLDRIEQKLDQLLGNDTQLVGEPATRSLSEAWRQTHDGSFVPPFGDADAPEPEYYDG